MIVTAINHFHPIETSLFQKEAEEERELEKKKKWEELEKAAAKGRVEDTNRQSSMNGGDSPTANGDSNRNSTATTTTGS